MRSRGADIVALLVRVEAANARIGEPGFVCVPRFLPLLLSAFLPLPLSPHFYDLTELRITRSQPYRYCSSIILRTPALCIQLAISALPTTPCISPPRTTIEGTMPFEQSPPHLLHDATSSRPCLPSSRSARA